MIITKGNDTEYKEYRVYARTGSIARPGKLVAKTTTLTKAIKITKKMPSAIVAGFDGRRHVKFFK